MSTKSKLYWLIGIATIVRMMIAATIELGNDEVYYLTYAQHLQWNYFDHPPIVALLIRLSTCDLRFTSEFFVRLGPILLAAFDTFLVFKIAQKIKGEEAGMIAALLFTASPYASIIAGTFIMPDAPQLFFWITALYLLVDIVQSKSGSRKLPLRLLGFGLVCGLSTMSKVHGVFLWLGFGLYLLIWQRNLLQNPWVYLAAFVTVIVISPILRWNLDNHFITYQFHSARVSISGGHSLDFSSLLRELFGGILYNNPFNYLLIALSLFSGFFRPSFIPVSAGRILLCVSIPLILVLLCIAAFRETLPHWSGPGYTGLLIYAGCWLNHQTKYASRQRRLFAERLPRYATAMLCTVVVAGILAINFWPGTIGKTQASQLGSDDFTLDMYGWHTLRKDFLEMYRQDQAGKKTQTRFIINNKWFPGAHIDNYVAQPLGLNFLALGPLDDIHTYYWLNQLRPQLKTGEDAYFITSSDHYYDPVQPFREKFEQIGKPAIITLNRSRRPARTFYIYLLKGYKGMPEVSIH